MVFASTCSSSTGRKTNDWRLNPGRRKEVVVKQEEQARSCSLLRVKGSKWLGSRLRFMQIS
jgi:hypothetical protein